MPRPRVIKRRRELRDRGGALVEHAAERSRSSARERVRRLTGAGRQTLQAALAASLAWLAATEVLGHPRPFFAPIAAIVVLGVSFGARRSRAVELALGVALGIAVGDLLIAVIGTGTLQIALVVALAMGSALLLGSGQLFATQAAASAVLVATLEHSSQGLSLARFLDALAGGAVALAVAALVLPANPLTLVRRASEPVLAELARTLEEIAAALEARSQGRAEHALVRARGLDGLAAEFSQAVEVSRETARFAPPRRRALGAVDAYGQAADQVDLAVRNVRVLARANLRAVRLGENVPRDMLAALRDLVLAVRALGPALEHPEEAREVQRNALAAAARATLVLEDTGNLSVSVIVGQVRSTAVDLLRGTGLSYEQAAEAVRAAADEARAERVLA